MKRPIEDHATRFSRVASEYDAEQDSDEYAACASLVVEAADPGPAETVLDIGTGTGTVALALAPQAGTVIGRDISGGMLSEARSKAESAGHENVGFGEGRFREPNVDVPVDVVVSNFALHHLSDDEKRDAIDVIADLEPERFVLGDLMLSAPVESGEERYAPEVDDPAFVGVLVDALTEAGFVVTASELIGDQFGVLVADRPDP